MAPSNVARFAGHGIVQLVHVLSIGFVITLGELVVYLQDVYRRLYHITIFIEKGWDVSGPIMKCSRIHGFAYRIVTIRARKAMIHMGIRIHRIIDGFAPLSKFGPSFHLIPVFVVQTVLSIYACPFVAICNCARWHYFLKTSKAQGCMPWTLF